MTEYICKCGRVVHKNSTAENTGNRDTARCAGCPYLLSWGDTAWDETRHAFVINAKGCECRMSRDLDYATHFGGNVHDKCTCCIASLDFDFLERVSAWIAAAYPEREIFGRFDRSRIRPVEYASSGRYRFTVTCTQNKAGVAAKAALLRQFFYPDGSRRDLTPEQEKEKILKDIEQGILRAAGKSVQSGAVYRSPAGTLYKIQETTAGQKRCYHVVRFDPLQCTWEAVNSSYYDELEYAQGEFGAWIRIEKLTPATGTASAPAGDEPAETAEEAAVSGGCTYQTDAGMVYAVRALPSGGFRIMCRYPDADWALATHPHLSAECASAASLQEVLDAHAERQGWKEYLPEAAAGPCADCRCRSCADPD